MLKRLVENDIVLNKNNPSKKRMKWWLLESRNPDTLVKLGKKYPNILKENVSSRPLLSVVLEQDLQKLESELHAEELIERQKDIEYWTPLKKEL